MVSRGFGAVGWKKFNQNRCNSAILLAVVSLTMACSEVVAPPVRSLKVPPLVRNVEPLPPSSAILSWNPLGSVPLATYAFIEGVMVEAVISGFIGVTSDPNALAVHVNDGVDYKGVWESGKSQCDWAATVQSPLLSAPGFGGCLKTSPYYTKTQEWRDTIILGGVGGNENIVARRGGGTNDAEWCSTIPPRVCHTISGTQSFNLTPLAVPIKVIAPAAVQLGPKKILKPDPTTLPLSFQISSTPATIHGLTVPRQALSWQWVPAESDSSTSTVNCPPPAYNQNRFTCGAYIYESGSMIVNGRVNGVSQWDTMTVVGTQVRLTLSKTSMLPSVKPDSNVDQSAVVEATQTIDVSVIDTSGHAIPFKTVTLTLTAKEGDAGHLHMTANAKPPGTINGSTTASVPTGQSGVATVIYHAPEPSGLVWLKGTSSGAATAYKKIMIEVPGLVPFGVEVGADSMIGGVTGVHTDNHNARPDHIARLAALMFMYNRQFPNGPKLKLNDSSLPKGGLFDINANWHPDHAAHRYGNNTDIRTAGGDALSNLRLNAIEGIWMHLIGQRGQAGLIKHTGAKPHYHLIFPVAARP